MRGALPWRGVSRGAACTTAIVLDTHSRVAVIRGPDLRSTRSPGVFRKVPLVQDTADVRPRNSHLPVQREGPAGLQEVQSGVLVQRSFRCGRRSDRVLGRGDRFRSDLRPGRANRSPSQGFPASGQGRTCPPRGSELGAGAGSPQRLGACTVDVGGGTEAACQGRGSTPRCACSAATRPFSPDGDTVSFLRQTVAKCAGRRAYRLRRCPCPARGRSAHSLGRRHRRPPSPPERLPKPTPRPIQHSGPARGPRPPASVSVHLTPLERLILVGLQGPALPRQAHLTPHNVLRVPRASESPSF